MLALSIFKDGTYLVPERLRVPRMARPGLPLRLTLGILSTHLISRLSSISLLTRFAPMNPAAPVTTVFIQLFFPRLFSLLSIRLSITAIVETVKPCAPSTKSTRDARKYPP